MEYYQYFRLKAPPFQPAAPDGAVYFSPTHLQGLSTLESGLTGEQSGLTLLTGEAGIGKTTLIYSLLQRGYKRVRIAHIDDPKLSFLDMMRSILAQLNLYSAGSTKLDYLKALDHLLELHGKDERIAIIVDESQVLNDDILEELRLLSNRGLRNDRCLLQLILVGQPELAERLKKPELRQLNQRISTRGVLKPLNTAEATMYVECRLSVQGGSCAGLFEPGALKQLLRRSDGIPRKINMLCHSAMMAAFYAGEKKVSVRTAKKTAAEYHDAVGIAKPKSRVPALPMLAVFGGAALASLLVFAFLRTPAGTIERTARPAKPVKQVKTARKREVKTHTELGAAPKTTASLASHPVEPRELPAADSTTFAASKTEVSAPGPILPAASSDPASTGTQRQSREAEGRGHVTVKPGDTLEKIAVRYFGATSGISQLIAANPQLTNINQLTVGEIIYLPPGVTPDAPRDQTTYAGPGPGAEDSPNQ